MNKLLYNSKIITKPILGEDLGATFVASNDGKYVKFFWETFISSISSGNEFK